MLQIVVDHILPACARNTMRPFLSNIGGIEVVDSEVWVIRRVAHQVVKPVSPALGNEVMCRWLVGTFMDICIGHVIVSPYI